MSGSVQQMMALLELPQPVVFTTAVMAPTTRSNAIVADVDLPMQGNEASRVWDQATPNAHEVVTVTLYLHVMTDRSPIKLFRLVHVLDDIREVGFSALAHDFNKLFTLVLPVDLSNARMTPIHCLSLIYETPQLFVFICHSWPCQNQRRFTTNLRLRKIVPTRRRTSPWVSFSLYRRRRRLACGCLVVTRSNVQKSMLLSMFNSSKMAMRMQFISAMRT